MKKQINVFKDQSEGENISSREIDEVINANKDLYDKLNKIPEIEALDSVQINEELEEKEFGTCKKKIDIFSRLKSIY